MLRVRSILFLLCLLPVTVYGQDNVQGSVVVHSDPRLSLLLKKPHNMEVTASASVVKRKAKSRPTAELIPAPGEAVTKSKSATVVSYSTGNAPVGKNNQPVKVVSYSTGPAAAKTVVKENSDDASSTGHAGGWSPPVRRKAKSVYSGKGFRVQIYNGPDRNRAIEVKTEFMRNYPGIRTYLSYIAPCFRVKVGDYKNRNEALGMLKEANSTYSPSMIVPDIVTISTF
jgi:hypothetical protein